MAIQESEVKVGALYYAGNNQLRKVTDLFLDDKERTRVVYRSKSIQFEGRPFGPGPNKSNPPFISTFCRKCSKVLSDSEVAQLRLDNIILSDE